MADRATRAWLIIAGAYHRYFSHRTYKTSRWFQLVLAVLDATATQKGALWWPSHHRRHHKYSDTHLFGRTRYVSGDQNKLISKPELRQEHTSAASHGAAAIIDVATIIDVPARRARL